MPRADIMKQSKLVVFCGAGNLARSRLLGGSPAPFCAALAMLFCGGRAWAQAGDFAPVVAKSVSRSIDLPGEIAPFLSVSLHAKVAGYVERMLVDRGSVVKQGDLLAELDRKSVVEGNGLEN